jgi:hypothetical protein
MNDLEQSYKNSVADVLRLTKAINRACHLIRDSHPFEALHVLEQAAGPQFGPWSNTVSAVVDEQSEEPSNFHDLRGIFKDGR